MGNLPKERVNQARPFLNSGVDYCGPFQIKDIRRRGNPFTRYYYVAVFICLATRAVHLEVVNDLTTEAFIATLQRFMARKGKCKQIFSKNARNFVKANKTLQVLTQLFNSEEHWSTIKDSLTEESIKWNFIPLRAPHFGGLWEAAVKSFKRHLKAVVGNMVLTYDEFYTLIVQIESCLNSRPLVQLSSDPSDLTALTPAHFLIGDSLLTLPEENVEQVPINKLSRWEHIQRIMQHFWKRWSKEYVATLQPRTKWTQSHHTFKGTLVLLKEDNLPPLQWRLGRIIEVFPGADGVVRVVLVKTKSSCFKRAVNKVCVLPIDAVRF